MQPKVLSQGALTHAGAVKQESGTNTKPFPVGPELIKSYGCMPN